jgi:hypothetical protein
LKTQIKATLLLFTILTILSCSKDGEDTDNSNDLSSTLIKRITINSTTEGDYIYNFTYDGNKIVSYTTTRDGELQYITNFTYTNDLITLIQSEGFNNSKTIISYDDNGRVVQENNDLGSYSYSYSFEYLGNTVKQTDEEICVEITISNNQVSSESYFDEANCTNLLSTASYSYDENPNAFSNIVGYNWYFSTSGNLGGGYYYIPAVNNVVDDGDFSYEYDYNENGYPRNVTVYDGDSMSETILIEYY